MSLKHRGTPQLEAAAFTTQRFEDPGSACLSPSSFAFKADTKWKRKVARKLRVRVFLVCIAGLAGILYLVQPVRTEPGRQPCHRRDPWLEPGWLHEDAGDPMKTAWSPIVSDPACPLRNDLADIVDGARDPRDAMFAPYIGQTVLILGDKLDRQGVEHFCKLLGQRASSIPYNATSSSMQTASTLSIFTQCDYPRLDLRLIAFDLEDDDVVLPAAISPHESVRHDRLRRRLDNVVLPTLQRAGGGRELGLIVLNAGFADLVRQSKPAPQERS
jgi:hypothetical protein